VSSPDPIRRGRAALAPEGCAGFGSGDRRVGRRSVDDSSLDHAVPPLPWQHGSGIVSLLSRRALRALSRRVQAPESLCGLPGLYPTSRGISTPYRIRCVPRSRQLDAPVTDGLARTIASTATSRSGLDRSPHDRALLALGAKARRSPPFRQTDELDGQPERPLAYPTDRILGGEGCKSLELQVRRRVDGPLQTAGTEARW
jgi:hypothetical protein